MFALYAILLVLVKNVKVYLQIKEVILTLYAKLVFVINTLTMKGRRFIKSKKDTLEMNLENVFLIMI
jgi:hypothetical protein